jgi:hypothetical protein
MNTMNLDHVPAIHATTPSDRMSERYRFVSTAEYLYELAKRGWYVAKASQVNTRKGNPEHAKHFVSLRHREIGASRSDLGSLTPEINLINSHNGSSRVRFVYGIFRLICTNGLMVGSHIEGASFRHDASALDVSEILTEDFFKRADDMVAAADSWSRIGLEFEEQMNLARIARDIRFGEESTVDPEALLVARREGDRGDDLWRVFNRIQENSTQGGVRFTGMRRQSRALTNIDKNVAFNTGIWNAAQEIALSRA